MSTVGGTATGLEATSDSRMADAYFSKIWLEAKHRWLRPNEIYDILCNCQKFKILSAPPSFPPSGTLILYDRKVLRNFRRDGHLWRKRNDNKTVREAHEHLKVGSAEKIHVYYAHGEDDSNFQRRVYWLLDKTLEHIVLVHYLQVKEGNKANAHPLKGSTPEDSTLSVEQDIQSKQLLRKDLFSYSPGNSEVLSSDLPSEVIEHDSVDGFDSFLLDELNSSFAGAALKSLPSNPETRQGLWIPNSVNSSGDDVSYVDHPSSNVQQLECVGNTPVLFSSDLGPFSSHISKISSTKDLSKQEDIFACNGEVTSMHDINTLSWEDLVAQDCTTVKNNFKQNETVCSHMEMPLFVNGSGEGLVEVPPIQSHPLAAIEVSPQHTVSVQPSINSGLDDFVTMDPAVYDHTQESNQHQQIQHQQWEADVVFNQQHNGTLQYSTPPSLMSVQNFNYNIDDGEDILRKLGSLDRWMERELPLVSTNSMSMQCQEQCITEDASSLTYQSHMVEELMPSFSQQILFNITELSPTWGFSSEETKVLITGSFKGDDMDFMKIQWYCMFGDIEIPAEIVQMGVLRCKAPPSVQGHVLLFLTCGDKQACSEVKEFEYRAAVNDLMEYHDISGNSRVAPLSEDVMLQIRFARLLLSHTEDVSVSALKMEKSAVKLYAKLKFLTASQNEDWIALEHLTVGQYIEPVQVEEHLLHIFLKQKLQDFLLSKVHVGGKGPSVLDCHGQGLLHLASGLGYDWAIAPALAAGIGINFRDKNGWTALHWAAAYGREKMVAALIAAGGNPGLVSDPTPNCPCGLTPADLAASAGYDGIAGYLSESKLTVHLSNLTLSENEHDKKAAADEGTRVLDYLMRSHSLHQGVKTIEDRLSLEDSLYAVRNATEAAARIHAAFREYSFRERMRAIEDDVDEFGISPEATRAFLAAKKIQKAYRKHKRLQVSAALCIQNKYRGWKGRKEFLNVRQKVITIQAYFRMHRARKEYHKLVWSVGILEKAVLRWRQKRKGLRGFHAEVKISVDGCRSDDFFGIGRRQAEESIERAVIRVQAMIRSHQARQQYRRMLSSFRQARDNFEQQARASQEVT
eukprot:c28893_g1_i1 orf=378-3620(-)